MSETTNNTEVAKETKNQTSEILYNWYFHVNSYDGTVNAFHKEDLIAYNNKTESKHEIYKSKTMSMDDMVEYVKLKEG